MNFITLDGVIQGARRAADCPFDPKMDESINRS
jgi:hypothetical protein